MAAPAFAQILRASQIRYRGLRVRGVPAILLGVSAVVASAGTVRALAIAAPSLGDVIRETKNLVEATRDRRRLNP